MLHKAHMKTFWNYFFFCCQACFSVFFFQLEILEMTASTVWHPRKLISFLVIISEDASQISQCLTPIVYLNSIHVQCGFDFLFCAHSKV